MKRKRGGKGGRRNREKNHQKVDMYRGKDKERIYRSIIRDSIDMDLAMKEAAHRFGKDTTTEPWASFTDTGMLSIIPLDPKRKD